LEVPKLFSQCDPAHINDSTESYEKSPFVDSIKVRLLSPTTKAIEVVNDRNVAIGKGLSLGRTLRWLNRDHFSPKWVQMVRDRFFQRMGYLVPEKTSGVFWHLLLPPQYGGMDLWLKEDIPTLCHKLPAPTRSLIQRIVSGESGSDLEESKKRFSSFLSNSSYRGYRLADTSMSVLSDLIDQMILPSLSRVLWRDAIKRIPHYEEKSAGELASLLKRQGLLRRDELEDMVKRPILFNEILSCKATKSPYNTLSLKKRYASLWDLEYRGDTIITEETLSQGIRQRWGGDLFDLEATRTELPQIGKMEAGSYNIVEEATFGMPNLRIDKSRLGTVKITRDESDVEVIIDEPKRQKITETRYLLSKPGSITLVGGIAKRPSDFAPLSRTHKVRKRDAISRDDSLSSSDSDSVVHAAGPETRALPEVKVLDPKDPRVNYLPLGSFVIKDDSDPKGTESKASD